MDRSVNRIELRGNVGTTPRINVVGESKVIKFALATNEVFKDRSGVIKEETTWHNIVAWRQLADLAEKYITTGTQIYVEGRLRSRSWDGQDGQKHYITEIVADTIQLLGKKSDTAQNTTPATQTNVAPTAQTNVAPAAQAAAAPAATQNVAPNTDLPEDDLPF